MNKNGQEQKIDSLDSFFYRLFEEYRLSEEIGMELHPEDHPDIIDDKEELEREYLKWMNEYFAVKKAFLSNYLKEHE